MCFFDRPKNWKPTDTAKAGDGESVSKFIVKEIMLPCLLLKVSLVMWVQTKAGGGKTRRHALY